MKHKEMISSKLIENVNCVYKYISKQNSFAKSVNIVIALQNHEPYWCWELIPAMPSFFQRFFHDATTSNTNE